MSNYSNRIPPIKIELSKEGFNNFIQFLTELTNSEDQEVKEITTKIKDKLLKYSVPQVAEDGTKKVSIRFYMSESSEIINQFINTLKMYSEVDYYSVLEKVRESYKNSNNSGV